MSILYFDSDYMEGCHPQILKRLMESNLEKKPGYGTDGYCEQAKDKIRKAIGNPDAAVWFLVGGTQTNATVIDALCQSYEGVISCTSGHINVHEAGAVEQSGHKIIALPAHDGKLDAREVDAWYNTFEADPTQDHCVPAKVVYISWPTEIGTLYSLQELKDLYAVCQKHGAYLFIDGARLGYGLASDTDVTLKDIAAYSDAFYIGGTKVGALFGEAVVFRTKDLAPHFFTIMKRHGALLAKGFALGIQFDTLFSDDLYVNISKDAIRLADRMTEIFARKGIREYYKSPTNQRFFLLEDSFMKKLAENVSFSFWEKVDENHSCVRLVTSWATTDAQIEELTSLLPE